MKISISKEADQIYLVISDLPADEQGYSLKMAESCPVDSLLPCSLSCFNGENRLLYRITGLTSLADRFSSTMLRAGQVKDILYTLRDTCARLPDYLLDPEDLLLDAEDIFLCPGSSRIFFCYVPDLQEQMPATRKLLAEFLLKHTDHKDPPASELVYSFYNKAADDSCVLSFMLPELLRDSRPQQPFSPGEVSPDRFPQGRGQDDLYGGDDFSVFCDSLTAAPGSSGSPQSSDGKPHPAVPRAVKRRRKHDRTVILLLIILAVSAGACAVFLFRLDAAQTGGVGFLSVSLIWLVRQQQYKKSGDLRNIWSDEEEEMEDDDTFYRSLLKEVYADGGTSLSQGSARSCSPDPSPGYAPVSAMSPAAGYTPRSAAGPPSGRTDTAFSAWNRPENFSGDAPCLVSLEPKKYNNIPLQKDVILIGKNARECDICLKSDTVSRVHAKIEKIADDYFLTDLFSTNGTTLNGRILEPNHAQPVPDGSEVTFAEYRYRMQCRK